MITLIRALTLGEREAHVDTSPLTSLTLGETALGGNLWHFQPDHAVRSRRRGTNSTCKHSNSDIHNIMMQSGSCGARTTQRMTHLQLGFTANITHLNGFECARFQSHHLIAGQTFLLFIHINS